jgi:hypothetical protein
MQAASASLRHLLRGRTAGLRGALLGAQEQERPHELLADLRPGAERRGGIVELTMQAGSPEPLVFAGLTQIANGFIVGGPA